VKASSSLRVFLLVFLCFLFASCGGGGATATSAPPTPPPPPPGGGGGGGSPSTVAIVMFENTSYERVFGSSAMPFLNSLVPQGALATQYFANTHPSIGNYFMLTTGQIISNDDAFTGTVSDDNIVRKLVAAGKTWKSYCQSLPSKGYLDSDEYPYIKHHDPFTYFTDVTENSAQAQNIVSLTQLEADEAAGTFPNFMFIAPDNEHNAHDCPGGFSSTCVADDKLAAADAFLSANVPALLNNATFKQNGVLMIVFDEGDLNDPSNGGGHVFMLALGSHVKAGFQSSMMYQHQNTLRTIGDFLGFTAPGAAESASPMSDLFQ
jgi:phosphatidylinositol-3-phosphatase